MFKAFHFLEAKREALHSERSVTVSDTAKKVLPPFNYLSQSETSQIPLTVSGCPTSLRQAISEQSLINPREKHSSVLVN